MEHGSAVRGVSLVASTMLLGVMAGVFFVYAIAVMPGLGRTDDRTFVEAFQSMDRMIVRNGIGLALIGCLVCAVVAGVLHRGPGERSVLVWIAAACVLYLAVVAITIGINVPLNDELKAAGSPDRIDVAAARDRFHETRWVGWNYVRTAANTAAFGCMLWALVLHGRSRGNG